MAKLLWAFIKLTALLSAWVLSMVVDIGSTLVMDSLGDLRGMLPSMPPSVIDDERQKGKVLQDKVKANADRSQRRTMAAVKRLPAEEFVDLFGVLGAFAGAGFVAYDLADICWEIHDQNELLALIGEPLIANPFVDGCDAAGELVADRF